MREIKFRAWDAQDKEMDYDPFCWPSSIDLEDSYNNLNTLISSQFGKVHHGGPPDEDNTHMRYLMQYTGLKDSKGKEIYEGDICRDEEGYTNPIEWEDDGGCFSWDAILFALPKGIDSKTIEIIGNIHENPELLK